jgi:hypothetical protein
MQQQLPDLLGDDRQLPHLQQYDTAVPLEQRLCGELLESVFFGAQCLHSLSVALQDLRDGRQPLHKLLPQLNNPRLLQRPMHQLDSLPHRKLRQQHQLQLLALSQPMQFLYFPDHLFGLQRKLLPLRRQLYLYLPQHQLSLHQYHFGLLPYLQQLRHLLRCIYLHLLRRQSVSVPGSLPLDLPERHLFSWECLRGLQHQLSDLPKQHLLSELCQQLLSAGGSVLLDLSQRHL